MIHFDSTDSFCIQFDGRCLAFVGTINGETDAYYIYHDLVLENHNGTYIESIHPLEINQFMQMHILQYLKYGVIDVIGGGKIFRLENGLWEDVGWDDV